MYRIGIDLGGTNIAVGVVDNRHNIIAEASVPTGAFRPAEEMVADMCRAVELALDKAGLIAADCASIGIGSPGTCDSEAGVVVRAYNLGWFNVPVCRMLHERFGIPVRLSNDANCAALAETVAGAAVGRRDMILITLGTGVGGGIIHNGKIFHGSNGMAGEVGHMSIEMDGEECPCGRRGCWERYASANALKRQTAKAWQEHPDSILARVIAENDNHVSGQSAFIAARQGCPVGQAVCDRYIRYLTAGIVNIINIFQPDTLAIGGGVSNESDEQLLLPLRRQVAAHSLPCNYDKMTKIVKAQLGNDAGIIGAALLGKNKRII